jgi:hypothetical protein
MLYLTPDEKETDMATFQAPERPRFSLGPKPRTERGKRRHEDRDKQAQQHAEAVHVNREDYLYLLGKRTTLRKRCG